MSTASTNVTVGLELPEKLIRIDRETLIKYAGVSGDFNHIHWSDRAARAAGLPDVISHGMLTMAEAVRIVTDWCGRPDAVVSYRTRFSRPVVVPDTDEGVQLRIRAAVTGELPDNRASIAIDCTVEGDSVLSSAEVVVDLARCRALSAQQA